MLKSDIYVIIVPYYKFFHGKRQMLWTNLGRLVHN